MEKRKIQKIRTEVLGMKNKKGITLIALVITVIASINIALGCVKVEAVTLQASSTNSPYAADVGALWTAIHDMETGTLGKSSLGSTTDNIDCHMVKRSEFGAAALLAISAYGAGSTQFAGGSKSISSTGNASGIYQLAASNYEYCAAYYYAPTTSSNLGALYTAPSKYKDIYYDTSLDNYNTNNNGGYGKIDGDALFPKGFLGSGLAAWVSAGYPVFSRYSSGLFSYNITSGTYSFYSRAVVVCGAGL